jgi:hypothetical protein
MKKKNLSSNKSFGIVFFVVFLLIAIYPLLKGNNINFLFLSISIIFLTLGILNSKILEPLNKIWIKFGYLLGKVISPIVMLIIFFLVVFPTGLLIKIFKKNYLGIRYDKKKNSYWIPKNKNLSSTKNQF